jgi:CheY-like chemotaxis protein
MKKVQHFLVVDDDYAARYLAGNAIEEAEIAENIIFCNNGLEALEYIKQNCLPTVEEPDKYCPELILLDLNMPVMDGYEFLEELASIQDLKHNNTSVILLSSSSYLKEESKVKRFSILGYLEKPVLAEDLIKLTSAKYKPFQ